ncbi:MAG TPA: hypothetical protein VIM25_09940 [Candidatus Limnocylindrales bacterium]
MFVPAWRKTGAQQRGDERGPAPQLVDPGERRPGEDRDHRSRERERPDDLVDRPRSTAEAVARAELPVIGQAEGHGARADRDWDLRAGHGRRRSLGKGREDRRRGDQLVDLAVLLEDGLEERQGQAGLDVEGHRAGSDILARAAQQERIEQVVGDEVPGGRVILRPPGGRDPVAQLGVEPGSVQRDIG